MTRRRWAGEPVPVALWGKDHWSTFAYIETRIVDHDGVLDARHMRGFMEGWEKYPTRLRGPRGGLIHLFGHNDYDCADDAVAAGLLVPAGAHEGSARVSLRPTAAHRSWRLTHRFQLTPAGHEMAGRLRSWKAEGGRFHDFDPGHLLSEASVR